MMNTNHAFVPYPYPSEIDKEELNSLEPAQYPGQITIIDTIEGIAPAIQRLRQNTAIGIDTETKPSFIPGKKTTVALLQLSTQEECFLFRLNRIGLPEALIALFEDASILKIGLSLQGDITSLRRLHSFEPQGFVELQLLCPGYGIKASSLQKIYGIMYRQYMNKSQRMTNWEAHTLTNKQQSYAALDAWASLRVYNTLMTHPTPHPTQFALL